MGNETIGEVLVLLLLTSSPNPLGLTAIYVNIALCTVHASDGTGLYCNKL